VSDSLSIKAIQAAYRETGSGDLPVIAEHLGKAEPIVAETIARAIAREEARCRSAEGKIGDYRFILKRVFLTCGPRTERIRRRLIADGYIQVPDHAARGQRGGKAKHRAEAKRKPKPKKATKESAAPKKTTEEKLLSRMRTIPGRGVLIDHVEMDGMSIAEIRECYGLEDDDEGWRLLLVYWGLIHHPLFAQPAGS